VFAVIVVSITPQACDTNVAYNPVCLLQELVQILHPKHVWLNELCIVACQHLVEDWRDVHGAVLRFRRCWQDDDAPAASRLDHIDTASSLRAFTSTLTSTSSNLYLLPEQMQAAKNILSLQSLYTIMQYAMAIVLSS